MAKRASANATSPPRSSARASWKGRLTFGLVSFDVEAFNAIDRQGSDIRFHQLHAKCHSRIRYQKVCPVHGVVSNDEIVSGYEQSKGKYVEVERDELEALRSERDRALTIDAFVDQATIDPLYFDGRMYYLLPAGASSEEAYAVIVAALTREERYGVGQVVFSGKDQMVLLRPLGGFLHMAMLNYDQEIRKPEDIATPPKSPAKLTRQVKLAQTLIREWTDDEFDFSSYKDAYRENVEELIAAKAKGHKVVAPEVEEEPEVVNLMDALKKSLGKSRGKTRRATKSRHKRSA
jgi:DNA end-binding protein Ku